jgi:hypothetical protein
MVKLRGPALQTFTGNAQPQHSISGPGPDAYKTIDATDRTTFLVSPGVYDCAILTVVLPNRPRPGLIGGHRPNGARAMAHYNKFSGPKLDGLKKLFGGLLENYGAAPNELVVSISHHTGARGNYFDSLADLVGQAVPGLASLSLHSYGAVAHGGQQQKLNAITVYLAPDGQIKGSQ